MPAFRFLHASDFHLERPPAGLAEMPDHLRDVLVEASYRAAANVFQAAIEHEVDFVALAGDLLAPERCGPRGVLFLRDQFARLAEKNIGVYWAGGCADRVATWPSAINWPANVHIFGAAGPQRLTVTKLGRVLCDIVGQSVPADAVIDVTRFDAALAENENSRVTIGLAHGDFNDFEQHSERIAYWALGGEHEPTLPQESRPLVHHPGSPQGRSRQEPGPHGCTLVEVTDTGGLRTAPIVTDVVRFVIERISNWPLTGATSDAVRQASDLERLLRERMQSLAEANSEVTLIVEFQLDGAPLPQSQRAQLPLPAIVAVLRGEFGYRSSPVWLDRVRLPPAPPLPESWFQNESLLGDVIRAARRLRHSADPIEQDSFLPGGELGESLRDIVQFTRREQAQAAIDDAASLTVGLLAPEEATR
jgi:hypothetical protein